MLRSSRDAVPSAISGATAGLRNGVAAAVAFAVTAFLVLTVVVGSTADEEEFRFAILSAWLHVDALLHGSLGLWTPLLGLGIPQPFVPNFLLHPLLPLLALLSPVAWARLLLATHTVLGGLGMWRLTRYLGVTPIVQAACVATFLFATPAQNYALTDFWPSHYLVWTSTPWLLLFAWRLLESDSRQVRFRGVALGLSLGLVAANTNPGHAIVYAVAVVAVLVTHWRQAIARWPWLLLAGIIAAAIAFPTVLQLARERPLFPAGSRLGLGDQGMPLPPVAAWNVLASPFGADLGDWQFTRTLFFGGPFALLAIVGCLRFGRRYPDLAIVLTASAILLFTALVPLPFVSARYQFRDPLTLSAILLAGLALDAIATAPRRKWLAAGVIVVQIVLLVAAAWPALRRNWSEDGRRAKWFRGAVGDAEAIDSVVRLAQPGGRMLLTPELDEIVFDNRRIEEGLGVNAFAYHRQPLLNGWFKGVSADVIWPDERLFYGRIATSRALAESTAAMSVLGIRWILATADDVVPAGLKMAGTATLSNDMRLLLYENTAVVDGGFLVDRASASLTPAESAACDNHRLLCADLAPLLEHRLPDAVSVRPERDGFAVRLLPAIAPRVLVLSQMYRRDWVAANGSGALMTRPILKGLLGVEIPPGTASVDIRYRPVSLIAALVTAWATIAGAVILLLLIRRRGALPDNSHA